MEEGDIIFLECPHNAKCIVPDIPKFAEITEKYKGILIVDATFATPVALKPLELGADIVLHSSTKYLGGHSDLLGGVLVMKNRNLANIFSSVRQSMGNVMGSMETFLLLRSLRTLSLRVRKQSKSAWYIAQWLKTVPHVKKVWHPFLDDHPTHETGIFFFFFFGTLYFINVLLYLLFSFFQKS